MNRRGFLAVLASSLLAGMAKVTGLGESELFVPRAPQAFNVELIPSTKSIIQGAAYQLPKTKVIFTVGDKQEPYPGTFTEMDHWDRPRSVWTYDMSVDGEIGYDDTGVLFDCLDKADRIYKLTA